ncbi:MAG: hypothetical protein HYX75_13430 [Acidobacteria bacterium]|nr:hypothetical protein [Acidobacteriota bacterium]
MAGSREDIELCRFKLRAADVTISLLIGIGLTWIVWSSARANLVTDGVDYYSILQKLVSPQAPPLVSNLHFVEQRSPGYPLTAAIAYSAIAVSVKPFVQTQRIHWPDVGDGRKGPPDGPDAMQLPPAPLRVANVPFKSFFVPATGAWIEWTLLLALISTSYTMFVLGIVFIHKAARRCGSPIGGTSLALILVVTSPIFIHNIVGTPTYATLAAFGYSALFSYLYYRCWTDDGRWNGALAGLCSGLLVLTRIETVLLAMVAFGAIVLGPKRQLAWQFAAGFGVAMAGLLMYNSHQFGTPFHLGVLKGDINRIAFDPTFILANLIHPRSGIVFWSPLIVIGLVSLCLRRERWAVALAIGSALLLSLYLVKPTAMYLDAGRGELSEIGGIPMRSYRTVADSLPDIRHDINRYVTVLAPMAVFGWSHLLQAIGRRRRLRMVAARP